MSQYWIIGGEYASTEFKEMAKGGAPEKIGPFESYEDAQAAWSAKAWGSVDSCNTRYEIIEA